MNLEFQKWIAEYTDYRIDQKDNKENLPWKDFRVHDFIQYLSRLIKNDNKKIIKEWEEEVSWIENGSKFEVNVNPFGSLRITCRKEIFDLNGEKIKVCKIVKSINDIKINQENQLAHIIYKKIKNIALKNNDIPIKEYDIKKLAIDLYNTTNEYHPDYIMFPTGLLRVKDNYYKLIFEFKGQGVGVPGSQIGLQFNIDLMFDKDKGLIRCWGYDIVSPSNTRKMNIQPSEWDEYFSPKIKSEKIINLITTTFLTY